jgi:hypothetical protein
MSLLGMVTLTHTRRSVLLALPLTARWTVAAVTAPKGHR